MLKLARILYKYYSIYELPIIAAFNMGSLGYLCNFKIDEYKDVLDSTIFGYIMRRSKAQGGNKAKFKEIAIDNKMRLIAEITKNGNGEIIKHTM